MNNQQFVWLAAIGTVLAGTWRYLQMAWNSVSSMVILQVDLEEHVAYEVLAHFWETMRPMPLNPRKFTGWHIFVRSSRRNELVPFETIGRSGILFWSGWRPIWVVTSDTGEKEEGGPKHDPDEKITIRYLRGTIDIDAMVAHLSYEHNSSMRDFDERAERRSRFQVLRRIGSRGRNKDSEGRSSVVCEGGQSWADNVRTNRRRRPIGQDWDNLGESPDLNDESPFHFLAYPDQVMESVSRVETWMSRREWYADRRIPWRRGFQLTGPPGSGKSSLIRAVGEHVGVPINLLDLASMTNEDLIRAWSESCRNSPCIIAIEDVDSVFNGRQNITSDNGQVMALSFDCLLNCISGVVRSDGVLLFLTTNATEHVDPALVRAGRIDETIHLDGMDEECRWRVARVVFGADADVSQLSVIVDEGEWDQPAEFHERCAKVAEQSLWSDCHKPLLLRGG